MIAMHSSVLRHSRLPRLRLHRPERLDELLNLLKEGVTPMSGGTDVLLWAQQDGKPDDLAWLGSVEALQTFDTESELIRIGAGVSISSLVNDPNIRTRSPALRTLPVSANRTPRSVVA